MSRMSKMQLKSYRDSMILNQYNAGLTPEELAYVYNISARRVADILKNFGLIVKVDNNEAKKLKSTRSPLSVDGIV